jgi:hypothetical protein
LCKYSSLTRDIEREREREREKEGERGGGSEEHGQHAKVLQSLELSYKEGISSGGALQYVTLQK